MEASAAAAAALEALNSVNSTVEGVTCFYGRWRIVKFRLDRLASQLQELQQLHQGDDPQSCEHEIVACISSTLSGARVLASSCSAGSSASSLREGKLQTQSKLDALAAALGTHIGDCELLLKNRAAGSRMECSRITAGTGVLLRWSIRDLLTRVQIRGGDPTSKQRALDSIVELMSRSDADALRVASQGGVPVLVQLLDPGMPRDTREAAAAGIRALARSAAGADSELVSEGAIAPLVRLLDSGTPAAREHAAAALCDLGACAPHNARAMAALGAVASCVALCSAATPGGASAAAGCLRHLALADPSATAAAVPALVALVRSGTSSAQESSVATLYNLACIGGSVVARRRICESGGVAALLRFLESSPPPLAAKFALGVLQSVGGAEDSAASTKKIVPGRKKMTLTAALVALVKSKTSSGGGGGSMNLPLWMRKLLDTSRESPSPSTTVSRKNGKLKIPKVFL